jgi:hypothetical protein
MKPKNIESEKDIEKKLGVGVKKLGGWTLKLLPTFVSGLPDRLVLYKGRAIFVELKSSGKRARPDQLRIHEKLRGYGFEVLVIDSSEGVTNFVNTLEL